MRAVIAASLAAVSVLFLAACGKSGFKGYDKEDLSKYIKDGQYKGLSYTPADTSVSDAEVEEKVNSELEKHTQEVSVSDRAVTKDDTVTLSYVCTVDGKKFEELCVKNGLYEMWYTYKTVYESDIVGKTEGRMPGDTFEYTVQFAKDHIDPDLKDPKSLMGKKAVFSVTVGYIVEKVTPTLTDDYASVLDSGCKTADEYKNKIRSELEAKKLSDAEDKKKADLWQQTLGNFEIIEYPESEIQNYKDQMHDTYEYYSEYYGFYSFEYFLQTTYNKTPESFEQDTVTYAEETVKQMLVLYLIVRAENITVSGDDYSIGASELLGKEEDTGIQSVEELENYYSKDTIEKTILWDKVLQVICDSASVSES